MPQPFFFNGPPRFAARTFAVLASTVRSVTRPFLSIIFTKIDPFLLFGLFVDNLTDIDI